MSGSHDTHHSDEKKPVAFTVPLIMAAVLVFIIILFLSLCDPKPHHAGEAGAHGDPHATEASHHDAAEPAAEHHHDAAPAAEVKADSVKTETTAPHTEAEAHHDHADGEHHH